MKMTCSPMDLIDQYKIPGFFHFTARSNLASIKSSGGLLPRSEHARLGIRCHPCADDQSRFSDRRRGLDRYVHLSLVPDHDMLYPAQQRAGEGNIIVIRVRPEVLILHGTMFTPTMANVSGVPIYPICDLAKHIDLGIVYGSENWQRLVPAWNPLDKRKAQLLIANFLPLAYMFDWRE